MRNRYYDPVTGRFTQMDPIGLAGGLNVYGFANGDPITYSDPFGLSGCPEGDEECIAEAGAKQEEAERRAQCAAEVAGLALATVGTASFGLAGARVGVALFRTYGHGLVARGMAQQGAAYGIGAVESSVAASQAQGSLAGARTSVYVAGQAQGLVGLQGHAAAGQSATLTDFVLDLTPGIGMARAWRRMRASCGI